MARSTKTGGREATQGVIAGRVAISVGKPESKTPEGFSWIAMSDVARLESGHTPSRRVEDYWNGDVPWIGIRDATGNHGRTIFDTEQHVTQMGLDNSSARLLPAGTVCLSRTASVGYVVSMGVPMATSQDFVNWVCGPELNPKYLQYALVLEQESIRRFSRGSTHQTMYYPEAKALHLLAPERSRQDAIVEVLGALDDKIAANKSVEATSDELVGAMYAQSVRDDAEEHPLFDVFHVDFGEAFKGASFTDPGVGRPLIRIRDLKTFTSQIWTSEERPRETVVRPGDVVVGMDAEFRATWWLGDDGLLNQRVCRVRGLDCTPALVAEALRAPLARIERYKSATTVIHLNKSDLQQAKVLMPTEANRISFEAKAQPLVDHRVSLARQRGHLARMRDALLPLLMSGKVTVRDAESVVEGVV